MILTSDSRHRSYLAGVGDASLALEELVSTTAEGPAAEAATGIWPVLAGDLSADTARNKWPIYTTGALADGVAAVFAFPLDIGAIKLGVLVTYRRTPGELPSELLPRMLQIADTCALAVLDLLMPGDNQTDGRRESGTGDATRQGHSAMTITEADDLTIPEAAALVGAEIHQASGMLMVQLGLSIEAALARLRAYAFAYDRPLIEVARDVVARRLEFEQ